METNEDTLEGHVALPALENQGLEKKMLAGPHQFDGKTLAPYGHGAEGLIDEALVGIRGDALYALTFLQTLVELQAGFDRYGKPGWDGAKAVPLTGDPLIDAATADVMRAVHDNVSLYQARANRWRAKLGRKGVEKAIKLVNEIIKEAKDTDVVPSEESTESGK